MVQILRATCVVLRGSDSTGFVVTDYGLDLHKVAEALWGQRWSMGAACASADWPAGPHTPLNLTGQGLP